MGYFYDKTIYFALADPLTYGRVPDFILKKYSKNIFIKWNAKIVEKCIKQVDALLCKEESYENFISVNKYLGRALEIYHEDRLIYKKTLQIFKKYFTKYSYAPFFLLKESGKYGHDAPKIDFGWDFCNVKKIFKDTIMNAWNDPREATFNVCTISNIKADSIYVGFLPNMFFSKNSDLIEKFIMDIYNPARKNYLMETEFTKRYRFEYIKNSKDINDVDAGNNIKIINDFLKEINLFYFVK